MKTPNRVCIKKSWWKCSWCNKLSLHQLFISAYRVFKRCKIRSYLRSANYIIAIVRDVKLGLKAYLIKTSWNVLPGELWITAHGSSYWLTNTLGKGNVFVYTWHRHHVLPQLNSHYSPQSEAVDWQSSKTQQYLTTAICTSHSPRPERESSALTYG